MSKFDEILNQVQQSQPDDATVAEAGERVRRTLFGAGASGVTAIRGCEDFRTLMPAYLQRTLSDARRMLLEDHVKECVACRKALDHERGVSKPSVIPIAGMRPKRAALVPRWAIAAALAVCAGGAVYAMRYSLMAVLDSSPRATVAAVDGMLYRLNNSGPLAATEGFAITDGQEVRTASGSRATLTLWDGSRVEMNERAELSVARGWRGTTIRLDRGHIIVQAAKQKQGRLYVATGDSEVSVKGTIFSVNKGTLGSRVSVVEGEVQVSHNGRSEALKPGEQARTSQVLESAPVAEEFAWSKDSARYAALLGELAILGKKLEAIPAPGLRYNSRLLVYVPEDARMFAAMPNVGLMLAQARQVLDERLNSSEVLRSWWGSAQNKDMRAGVEMMLDKLKELSAYLGEEIILTLQGEPDYPVIFAEVKSEAGLRTFLDRELTAANVKGAVPYAIRNNILILSDKPAHLQAGEMMVARGGAAAGPMRARIEQTYRNGASWLFASNLEQITGKFVPNKSRHAMMDLGFDSAQSVIVERREIAGRTENRATLQFKGERKGIAAMLGNAGPISTLDFITPEAGAVASLVVKQPRALVEELMNLASRNSSNGHSAVAKFESTTGLRLLDDLAGPIGSEITIALDGALIPVPNWKLALEVNSPQRLQTTLEKLIEVANQEAPANMPRLAMVKEDVNGRTFYKLSGGNLPWEAHWTYVDSYLLMGASRALLTDAMQKRQMGLSLVRSEKFRSLLPTGSNPNFSGLFYQNLAGVVSPLADTLQNFINLSPEQKQSLQTVKEMQASLIAVSAEPDRIVASTTGNLFGLPLGSILSGLPMNQKSGQRAPMKTQ
ncbi:MAG: FecR domain-containing protein [Acidobacteria bacterium]|nr:FecR domain-containing protein [Acidobacteriota bacterium]